MQKIENKTFIINNSREDTYYSQRNNCYIHKNNKGIVDASGCTQCNVSSLVMTADINGWKFPEGKYDQPEDNLMDFIFSSQEVDNYYKQTMPVLYEDYKNEKTTAKGKIDYFTPNEVHAVLAFAFNKWVKSDADKFRENASLSSLVSELIKGKSVVISGKFGSLNHIVSLVGAKWQLNRKQLSMSIPAIIESIKYDVLPPSSFIINDPYGDYHNYKSGLPGKNIEISFNDFIAMIKPLGNYSVKMAHFIKNGAATI